MPEYVFDWNKWVPKKVGFVAWRAEKERLPTRVALAERNVRIESDRCVICGDYAETSDHVFMSCQLAQTVWSIVSQWCKIPTFSAFCIQDVLSMHGGISGSQKRRNIVQAIVHVTIWSIWNTRNDAVFNSVYPSVPKIIEEVKHMSYLWVKSRSKDPLITWETWRCFEGF
ncbi:uncharacterized protein LOC110925274 [Helianthus annuus]|uniref:uncharacterized protein LOC110925274 n=1 Tax=Helianthus annuus TaxID=4232 RepID=UPI000B8F1973|nr:uncharacterized protein LOC110925274 [Helianthus annuus]